MFPFKKWGTWSRRRCFISKSLGGRYKDIIVSRCSNAWHIGRGCSCQKNQEERLASVAQVPFVSRFLPWCTYHQRVFGHLLQELYLQIFLRRPKQRVLPQMWNSPWRSSRGSYYLRLDYLKDSRSSLPLIQVKRCRSNQRNVPCICGRQSSSQRW